MTLLFLLVAAATAGLVLAVAVHLRPVPTRSIPLPAPDPHGGRDPPRATALSVAALGVGVVVAVAFGPLGVAASAAVVLGRPHLKTRRHARRRREAVEAELAEVVDLLSLAVRAGMTVPHAVAAVARRATGPLATELARVVDQTTRGRRFADALDELPERAGEPARPLAATLADCERYGSPVGEALERLAADARERQRRAAEQAARRLPVALLFPLVLCILPAFALLAVAPLIADAVLALRP
ncbi:MAG TPA: type II secretion system F family protein [Acidimicrobiales bacterium]|nr:type II secretion system F family protein [Acidimicrobiales bacterium]